MTHSEALEALRYSYQLPSNETGRLLQSEVSAGERTLAAIGSAVFELEKALQSGLLVDSLELVVDKPGLISSTVSVLIERLVTYVLMRKIEVKAQGNGDLRQTSISSIERVPQADAVCLYSGGVDSTAGILWAARSRIPTIGLFCAHQNQSRAIHIVREISNSILQRKGLEVLEFPVAGIRKGSYAELRGFLYMCVGAAIAARLGATRLLVTECGPTMYQMRFSPIDLITMTTHPFVVSRAQDIINAVLDNRVKIETPFENLTKAEVMVECPDPSVFPLTHSCVSQRLKTQDGTCYGCVVRRLAAQAAGVPDCTYERNPLVDEQANSSNVTALLEFSSNLLLDYSKLTLYQRDFIAEHGKRDLFERFALDNFTGIYAQLQNQEKPAASVAEMYATVARSIGEDVFEARMRTLRRQK